LGAGKLAAFVLATIGLVAAGGCKRKQPVSDASQDDVAATHADAGAAPPAKRRVLLDHVALRVEPGSLPVEIYPQELSKRLGRALAGSGEFFAAKNFIPPDEPYQDAALEVSIKYYTVENSSQGGPAIVAVVAAELRWLISNEKEDSDPLTLRENILAEKPLASGTVPDRLVAAHVAQTVLALEDGLVIKERLRRAGGEQLASAARGKEIDTVMWALQVIAERRPREAADAVIELLDSETPGLRAAAVAAAVALADPRAIEPLTRHADFTDYDTMRTVIEAVTAIGGEEAIEFLEFVQSGHPDDDIKQRAEEGLRRLRHQVR
jgi:hypothetical protein